MTDPIARLHEALRGRYAIERQIGEGGMATVYLAEDLRHGRKVALKVLKPELAAVVGAERFLSEIKTTANLQHPHILPLFDSGEEDGLLFYVMPFVEGETLRERLDREHQLPVDEAVRLTINVAEALEYAHSHGVIHRDIKPANILLQAGKPVLSDFGIALAVGAAGGGRLTETGLSLGTPYYMSPEQATGDTHIGPAADVYALGCVLYEMLVGQPPHSGGTPQAVLGRIITGTPDRVTEHRRTVPANVEAAVERALEKVPADRFTSAGDFAAALADSGFRHREEAGAGSMSASGGRRGGGFLAMAVGIALAAGALLGWWMAPRAEADSSGEIVVTSILPPEGEDFSERESFGALSPDGTRFAFVSLSSRGERSIWIRSLDSLLAEPVPGTAGASAPFWSPEGGSLAYFSSGRLVRLDLGGSPTPLCDAPSGSSGSWGETGIIVIATDRGIERTTAEGGGCEVAIPSQAGERAFEHPSLLPGNRQVFFERGTAAALTSSIEVGDLGSGTSTTLLDGGMSPTFVPPGYVVYGRFAAEGNSILFAQALTPDLDAVEGPAVGVSGPVRTSNLVFAYSASANGSLIYMPGFGDREKLVVDRRGEVVDTLRQDGTWTLAFARREPWVAMAGAWRLWLYDLDRGVPTQLVSQAAEGAQASLTAFPVWSPGDSLVAFGACGLSAVRVSDLSTEELVPEGPDCLRATDWSSDGRYLIADQQSGGDWHATTLVARDLQERVTVPVVEVESTTGEGHLSPDDRWIAYRSEETGRSEIFVRPFLRPGRAIPVSTDGGRAPRWRGSELFYETPDGRIMAVEVGEGPELLLGRATMLFRAPEWTRPLFFDVGTPYDVSPDGELFAVRLTASGTSAVLVQNWRSRLQER